jgi:hypothetical protein
VEIRFGNIQYINIIKSSFAFTESTNNTYSIFIGSIFLRPSTKQIPTREHSSYPQSPMPMMPIYLQPFLAPQYTIPHVVLGSGTTLLRMFFSLLMEIK